MILLRHVGPVAYRKVGFRVYVHECFACRHEYLFTMRMPGAGGGQRKVPDLELELQMSANHHMDSAN